MKLIKTAYINATLIAITLVKFPFSIISAICIVIEMCSMRLFTILAEWSNDEKFINATNDVLISNAEANSMVADDYIGLLIKTEKEES